MRGRRRRRARRALVAAVVAVLVLAAAAASQIARTPDVEREVPVGEPREAEIERVLIEAVKATLKRPECRPTGKATPPQIAERPLAPRLAAALPALAKPVPGADPQQAVTLLDPSTTGTIVRQSVRTLEFPGGHRLTVFVLDGAHVVEQNPAACAALRRKRAAELASGELLAAVERRLAAAGRPQPGQQWLYMSSLGPGEPGPSTTGFIVAPKLRTGIVDRDDIDPNTRRYEGIVSSPRVADVRIDPAHGQTLTIGALDGFYMFTLRRGSGQARVTELSASGERIRSFRLPR